MARDDNPLFRSTRYLICVWYPRFYVDMYIGRSREEVEKYKNAPFLTEVQ